LTAIVRRLANPARQMSFEELGETWFAARITARIRGYAALADDAGGASGAGSAAVLDLLRRVRGGIGQVLIEAASPEAIAGLPCPWTPPCALDVLFREQGRSGGHGIPKPYVLAAEPRGRDLAVAMTLFGFAADWSAAAGHALVAALQHRIDWHALRPELFLPQLEFESVTMRAIDGVTPPPARDLVELQFLTPMNAEGDDPLDRPATVLARLAGRIRGLALWHDAEVAADWAALERLRNELSYDTAFLRRRRIRRRSGRQRHYYDTEAVEGMLRIAAPPEPVRAILALGREAHVGKGASEGFGRYLLA
jgi:hypothetical protein